MDSWYDVCGIRMRSELAFEGLAPAQDPSGEDLTVRLGDVEAPDRWPASGIAAWRSPEADVISWAGAAKLRLSSSEIVVDSGNLPFARQCVIGPGLGTVLHRRGRLVLHGSAVDVGGRAVVLLGQKGAGKSTTAAALVARGHALLTDDLVVVDDAPDGQPCCFPGPLQVKLWPESAEALGLSSEMRPFVEGLPKGVWFGVRTAAHSVPIAMICSLWWGATTHLAPLDGTQAFGAVFEHAYAPRFLGAEAGRVLVAPTARFCSIVPVHGLERRRDLGAVDDVVARLEKTLQAL